MHRSRGTLYNKLSELFNTQHKVLKRKFNRMSPLHWVESAVFLWALFQPIIPDNLFNSERTLFRERG